MFEYLSFFFLIRLACIQVINVVGTIQQTEKNLSKLGNVYKQSEINVNEKKERKNKFTIIFESVCPKYELSLLLLFSVVVHR